MKIDDEWFQIDIAITDFGGTFLDAVEIVSLSAIFILSKGYVNYELKKT